MTSHDIFSPQQARDWNDFRVVDLNPQHHADLLSPPPLLPVTTQLLPTNPTPPKPPPSPNQFLLPLPPDPPPPPFLLPLLPLRIIIIIINNNDNNNNPDAPLPPAWSSLYEFPSNCRPQKRLNSRISTAKSWRKRSKKSNLPASPPEVKLALRRILKCAKWRRSASRVRLLCCRRP